MPSPPRRLAHLGLLSLPLLASTACIDREVASVETVGNGVETRTVPAGLNRQLDILFVIDNSSSMTEEHRSLQTQFPRLLDGLKGIGNVLPDIHIGVVTSDLGTMPYQVNDRCAADRPGEGGKLRAGRGCLHAGQTFLSDLAGAGGARTKNYDGDLNAAFACMATMDATGCGFEQHLGAMKLALTPGVNDGFLRKDAKLAIVIVADEDDCSALDPKLFDMTVTALGPMSDFRCHSDGVVCDDDPDPTRTGPRHGCRARPQPQFLSRVTEFADDLIALKGGDRNKVIVAAIVGNPDDVQIARDRDGNAEVVFGCPTGGLGASRPGIRFNEFLRYFPGTSLRETLCTSDLSGALTKIGRFIDPESPLCLDRVPADRNPEMDGRQVECSVIDDAEGEGTPLPQCDVGDNKPPSVDIRFVADEVTNAVIVTTYPRLWKEIEETIKRLDKMPRQVLIDVLAAEVRLDDDMKLGVEWAIRSGNFVITSSPSGLLPAKPPQSIIPFGGLAVPLGLNVFAFAADKVLAALNALSTENRVNVLSNPTIMTTENRKAVINVSTSVPIVTSQQVPVATGGITGNSITQTVEYKDAGIILTVTPRIGEQGTVALDVKQEVNEVGANEPPPINSPRFTKREAETSVVLLNNQTLVLGGLIQNRRTNIRIGIPFLNRIPILGYLFGTTEERVERTELILLITPRTVGTPLDANRVTDQMRRITPEIENSVRQAPRMPPPTPTPPPR